MKKRGVVNNTCRNVYTERIDPTPEQEVEFKRLQDRLYEPTLAHPPKTIPKPC